MVCGWELSTDALKTTSERIVAAKKLFNIRAGWTPAEDRLPGRFFDSPLTDDPQAKLSEDQFHRLVSAYNVQRRWTEDGWIPDAEMDRLGLSKWFPSPLPVVSTDAPTVAPIEASEQQ